jgi:CRISPR-associated protein Csm4
LATWLLPFLNGEPPFVLSDGFPAGLLPKPLFPRSRRSLSAGIDTRELKEKKYDSYKKQEKAPFQTIEEFRSTCASPEKPPTVAFSPWVTTHTPHATIDRMTMTTGGEGSAGNLYETTEKHLPHKDVDVYLRSLAGQEAMVEKNLEQIGRCGFGKDKSVGLGRFTVKNVEKTTDLREVETVEGFINLSSFVPAANDPKDGYWRLRVKYGRLGENAGEGNPFKKPLLQIEPGAVFKNTRPYLKPWYGRMVESLSASFPQAVQNCYTLTCRCRWPEKAV